MSGIFGGAAAKKWEFVADVYDFGTDGVLATVETPDFEDGFEYRVDYENISVSSSNADPQVELYQETTAAYTSVGGGTLTTFGSQNEGQIFFPLVRYDLTMHCIHGFYASDHLLKGWVVSPAQKILKARFSFDVNSFDAGIIRLYRRAL